MEGKLGARNSRMVVYGEPGRLQVGQPPDLMKFGGLNGPFRVVLKLATAS